jgi:dCMP deaminase
METAHVVAKQSRAQRAQVGALLVRDNNILAYGYNGTPSGFDNNCEDKEYMSDDAGGWLDYEEIQERWPHQEQQLPKDDNLPWRRYRTVTKREVLHAESNALMKIARSTQTSEGATLYVTLSPCFECAKLIVQSGVKRVVFGQQYRDSSSITFLKQANIEVEKYERAVPLGRNFSPPNDPRMYSPGEPEEGVLDPDFKG